MEDAARIIPPKGLDVCGESKVQLQPPLHFNLIYQVLLTFYTSGDENHLCGASLRESHKIHHAHGIDYHHMHQRHGAGTLDYSSMSVNLIQLHE
jgi:hypothetical protein